VNLSTVNLTSIRKRKKKKEERKKKEIPGSDAKKS
jgi:hypothetical protein